MKKYLWRKSAAIVLAAVLLAGQPVSVQAADWTMMQSEIEGSQSVEDQTETDTEDEFEEETESESVSESVSDTEMTEETDSEEADPEETDDETESETSDQILSDETESEEEIRREFVYEPSSPYSRMADRKQYTVDTVLDGLPSFITQEMIIGALHCQDEMGYPASVTIAQIIQESGYGVYGPGGERGAGLSGLAYHQKNLFGIKGSGSNGSVLMTTSEMADNGEEYTIKASFRAYHSYSECIEDRGIVLKEGYEDLLVGVYDANTFAVRIAQRWATDFEYAEDLLDAMYRYDLYRLDNMTLTDADQQDGCFYKPCPGSVIEGDFGYQESDCKIHMGLDMNTGADSIPFYAAADGVVVYVGMKDDENQIVIDQGNGLVTKYMHFSETTLKAGEEVKKGQRIGMTLGGTDLADNKLYFQVEENGIAVNPLPFFKGSGSYAELQKKNPLDSIIGARSGMTDDGEH